MRACACPWPDEPEVPNQPGAHNAFGAAYPEQVPIQPGSHNAFEDACPDEAPNQPGGTAVCAYTTHLKRDGRFN